MEDSSQCCPIWVIGRSDKWHAFNTRDNEIVPNTGVDTYHPPNTSTPFMGAGSAIVIYLFLNSQLKEIVYKLEGIEPYEIYPISIIAGFSGWLVLRAVDMGTKEKR